MSWRSGTLGFYRACAFELSDPFPSAQVVESIGGPLERVGWRRLTQADDEWVSDSWIRFADGTSTPERVVNQYTAAWRSPNGRQLVHLGVRHYESADGSIQAIAHVALWIEPAFAWPFPHR